MKTVITILGQQIELSAKLIAKGVAFPNEDKAQNRRTAHNHFKVSVKGESKKVSFDFYGSQHDHQNGVTELDEKSLIGALSCFCMDATAGKNTFEDFCSEMGYDQDSRKAECIHRECEKSAEKLGKLFGDIYEAANQVQQLEEA